ncbi:hypothetical protein Taro_038780 [Colocasia esculenta]|uniref:Ribosomal protein L1 n=1 Tax=Colocasia esculenta TaxID=4460 RepID=A0A843WK88_COLES|nr:hypothetical protein [Colocasia esculenta]
MAAAAGTAPGSSTRIDREAASRAVDSLVRWLAAQAKQRKAQLLEHDEPVRLLISLKRIPPQGRTNPYLIPLPHPVHPLSGPDAAAVCLIADDRPSTPASPSAAEERIRTEGIPVSEVITLSGLRADYKPYEARRKLCGSYDVFLADRRVLPLLPRLLGKQFFKKKKQPLPVDLSRKGWPEQLRRCLTSAALYLRTGTCCQMDVGRASQGREKIVDNVIAAMEGAMAYIPKKWSNIRSIHLKSDESVALPIYRALPEIGFKIDTGFQKKAVEDTAEEELNGEVIQGQKKGEKEQEKEDLRSEKERRKKGRIHEVRYMDTNLDDVGLMSGLVSDDKNSSDEGEELLQDKAVKDSRKRKKDAKMPKKTGSKDNRSDDNVKETKTSKKKVQPVDTNVDDGDFISGAVNDNEDGSEEGGEFYEEKKNDANKRKKDAKEPKASSQGSYNRADSRAKKSKSNDKKLDDKGTNSKTNQRSKMRHARQRSLSWPAQQWSLSWAATAAPAAASATVVTCPPPTAVTYDAGNLLLRLRSHATHAHAPTCPAARDVPSQHIGAMVKGPGGRLHIEKRRDEGPAEEYASGSTTAGGGDPPG